MSFAAEPTDLSITSTSAAERIRRWPVADAVTLAAIVVSGVGRLPFLHRQLTIDESGFLIVGNGWTHGTSLYGDYWVDRPPLLVGVFKLAGATGGATSLRVIGLVATMLTVAAIAFAVRRLAGSWPAAVAAVVATAFLVNPAAGAIAVNGELLAAPWEALGMALVVAALTTKGARSRLVLLGGAGAAAAAAVLTKQNMIAVVIFAAVTLVLFTRQPGRTGPLRWFCTAAAAAVTGFLATTAAVLAGAAALGTGPGSVFDASYRFRFEASRQLERQRGPVRERRWHELVDLSWQHGFVALAVLVIVVALLWWRPTGQDWVVHRVMLALLPVLAYAVFSMRAGGVFWPHYLVQLVVPLAIGAGLLAHRLPAAALPAIAWPVVACLVVGITQGAPAQLPRPVLIGHALAEVANPGDTLTVIRDHADIQYASGMASPYPYLWGLPASVRDADGSALVRALTGPERSTWVLFWVRPARLKGARDGVEAALAAGYRPAGMLLDRQVYLRTDVSRLNASLAP